MLVNWSHTTFIDLGIVSQESSGMATIHWNSSYVQSHSTLQPLQPLQPLLSILAQAPVRRFGFSVCLSTTSLKTIPLLIINVISIPLTTPRQDGRTAIFHRQCLTSSRTYDHTPGKMARRQDSMESIWPHFGKLPGSCPILPKWSCRLSVLQHGKIPQKVFDHIPNLWPHPRQDGSTARFHGKSLTTPRQDGKILPNGYCRLAVLPGSCQILPNGSCRLSTLSGRWSPL